MDHASPDPSSPQEPTRSYFQSFLEGCICRLARNPWCHFWTAFTIAVSLSGVGIILGDFTIEVNNKGWFSRGTEISNRQSQVLLLSKHRTGLLQDNNDALWRELEENVQPGWQNDEYSILRRRRLLMSRREQNLSTNNDNDSAVMVNMLKVFNTGCDFDFKGPLFRAKRLIAIWKTQDRSPFDSAVIQDICRAEQTTQAVLDERNLCVRCTNGKCIPPLSVVSYARFAVQDIHFQLSCEELATAWDKYQEINDDMEEQIVKCVKDFKTSDKSTELPTSCPFGFSASMVSKNFDSFVTTGGLRHEFTSSVFETLREPQELYEQHSKYDRGTGSIEGVYDTSAKDFQYTFAKDSIGNDLALAVGSAAITALAILMHTRSPMITIVGLSQICLSFPVAYFVYKLVARVTFFPFLNFIGIFVAFALGADDIFVAVDKWKNARHSNKFASVEDVALIAIPDAASAMFLTSTTTAGAFFATAVCPIAPLKCFAIFCGLLISIDYLLCLVLVLPILCVYDKWTAEAELTLTLSHEESKSCDDAWNCCCTLRYCCNYGRQNDTRNEGCDDKSEVEQAIFIRKILGGFYCFLHRFRWAILISSIGSAAFAVVYVARNLKMPESSAVPILRSSHEFARHQEWRQELLYSLWEQKSTAKGYMVWGLKAADTGDHTDPDSFTTLVLDDAFEPSSKDAQHYLLGFCDKMFAREDFAKPTKDSYVCPMNQFDEWIRSQSLSPTSATFVKNCGNATQVPIAVEDFHPCFSSWAAENSVSSVMSRDGILKLLYIPYFQNLHLASPYEKLDAQWHLIEDWTKKEHENAPNGVNNFYFSSFEFWWYDTNGKLLETAFLAAGITLGISGVVVLIYFRSLTLTLFSVGTIAYVLVSTTALIVAWGWTLGFIESICLAILIGISCDFVIHLGHAYASPTGLLSRNERTKRALLTMGPSILAASFTTIAASIIMMFTIFRFYVQFAQILMFTMLTATLASIIIFLTLTDCFGPNSSHRTSQMITSASRSSATRNSAHLENSAKKTPTDFQSTADDDSFHSSCTRDPEGEDQASA